MMKFNNCLSKVKYCKRNKEENNEIDMVWDIGPEISVRCTKVVPEKRDF